jgi:hypothetical protein
MAYDEYHVQGSEWPPYTGLHMADESVAIR